MRPTILTLIGISLATAVAFLALRSPAPPVALVFTGSTNEVTLVTQEFLR
jgi:hypothetical protein